MERKSFIFYKDWRDAIKDLQDSVRLEVYDAIVEYGLTGIQPKLKPIANVAFNFIRPQLDRNLERYQNGCKGAEHGKKGGRPPKNKDNAKPHKNPIKTPNDNDNDIYKKEIYKEKDLTIELHGQKKMILPHLFGFMQKMLSDQISIERLCMNHHLKPEELETYIKKFFVLRSDENNTEIETLSKAQLYFGRWLNTEIYKQPKNKLQSYEPESNRLHPALR